MFFQNIFYWLNLSTVGTSKSTVFSIESMFYIILEQIAENIKFYVDAHNR